MKKKYSKTIELRYSDSKLSGHFGRKSVNQNDSFMFEMTEEMAGDKYIQLDQRLNSLEKIWFVKPLNNILNLPGAFCID